MSTAFEWRDPFGARREETVVDPPVLARSRRLAPVEELAGVWVHEVSHLLRDHPGRGDRVARERGLTGAGERLRMNIAADCEINDDVFGDGLVRPEGAVEPRTLGLPEGELMEDYLRWFRLGPRTQHLAWLDCGSGADGLQREWDLGPDGAHVIYDPVGGAYAESALRAMAWGGRFLVIGFAAGEIPKIPLNLPLLKSCDIRGVFWGEWTRRFPEAHRANMRDLMEWTAAGKLSAHVHAVFPLAETARALEVFSSRGVMGKVLLRP